ncbi:MAG: hypothetical protein WCJ58_03650 [bacterium]
MIIIYTSQAKDDLARIDWRIRETLIKDLEKLSTVSDKEWPIQHLGEQNLSKVLVGDYAIIGQMSRTEFSILSVLKRPKIKVPQE